MFEMTEEQRRFTRFIGYLEEEVEKSPHKEGIKKYLINFLAAYHKNRLPYSPLAFQQALLSRVGEDFIGRPEERFDILRALSNAAARSAEEFEEEETLPALNK